MLESLNVCMQKTKNVKPCLDLSLTLDTKLNPKGTTYLHVRHKTKWEMQLKGGGNASFLTLFCSFQIILRVTQGTYNWNAF